MTHDDWPTSELAREWTHRGLTCRIYRNPRGTLNGYVELPEDHQDRHLDLQFRDRGRYDVHGGITYGGCGRRVVGFDTLHAWDHFPGGPELGLPGRRWSEDDVAAETSHLADQIARSMEPSDD